MLELVDVDAARCIDVSQLEELLEHWLRWGGGGGGVCGGGDSSVWGGWEERVAGRGGARAKERRSSTRANSPSCESACSLSAGFGAAGASASQSSSAEELDTATERDGGAVRTHERGAAGGEKAEAPPTASIKQIAARPIAMLRVSCLEGGGGVVAASVLSRRVEDGTFGHGFIRATSERAPLRRGGPTRMLQAANRIAALGGGARKTPSVLTATAGKECFGLEFSRHYPRIELLTNLATSSFWHVEGAGLNDALHANCATRFGTSWITQRARARDGLLGAGS